MHGLGTYTVMRRGPVGCRARGCLGNRPLAVGFRLQVQHLSGAPVAFAAMSGTDVAAYTRERPGMSALALEDGVVYHTYSTYARVDWTASGACASGSTAPQLAQRDRRLVAPP